MLTGRGVHADLSAPRVHLVRLTRLIFRHVADETALRHLSVPADLTPQVSPSHSNTVVGRGQMNHPTRGVGTHGSRRLLIAGRATGRSFPGTDGFKDERCRVCCRPGPSTGSITYTSFFP